MLLVAGVHGDELNPIGVLQRVFADLDATKLSGAVIGIIGLSRPGVEYVTRGWPWTDLGKTLVNPNRTWPGEESGNPVERHSWLVMNRLIKGNADVGADSGAVQGDPLSDVRELERVRFVMKGGKVYKDELNR